VCVCVCVRVCVCVLLCDGPAACLADGASCRSSAGAGSDAAMGCGVMGSQKTNNAAVSGRNNFKRGLLVLPEHLSRCVTLPHNNASLL